MVLGKEYSTVLEQDLFDGTTVVLEYDFLSVCGRFTSGGRLNNSISSFLDDITNQKYLRNLRKW
jgi:hypothetical protein